MFRKQFTFAEFKDQFIDHPDGYMPVYSSFKEDHYSNKLPVLEIDMICEWRLTDNKVLFVRVGFESEEEFDQIIEYLRHTAYLLNKAILKNINRLNFVDIKMD